MQTRTKAIVIVLAIAVPAFALGAGGPVNQATHFWDKIWPFGAAAMGASPTGAQMPFLIVLGIAEALSFGAAVAFLVLGGPLVRSVAGGSRRAQMSLYIAGAWVLGNWWVHDSLHQTNSENLWSLITIEYAFHVTLIIAGATVCWQLYRAWSLGQGGGDASGKHASRGQTVTARAR